MKLKLLSLFVALSSVAGAATVTVTAGFGAQGLSVFDGASLAASQFVAVGNLSGGTFTQFASTIEDTGKVNGVFTAQEPASLNNLPIHLWVGNAEIGSATSYVILSSNAGTAFPPDVAAAGGPTFNAAVGANLTVVDSVMATYDGDASSITFVPIPEPTVTALGALGLLGLLRRRR